MKKITLLLLYLCINASFFGQIPNNFDNHRALYDPQPSEVIDRYDITASPGAIIEWNNFKRNQDESYDFILKTPISFTAFGVGWDVGNSNFPASDFEIIYRSRSGSEEWSKWFSNEGYVKPEETPTDMYWTDLLFLDNEAQHTELEFNLYVPSGVSLSKLRLSLIDMTGTGTTTPEAVDINNTTGTLICPPFPTIIPRSQWCGSYTACHNTTSYANISATHTVVHHGASPDTYTDGATVVRGYWNYHVNTLGWSDIGYNYLFCKAGNFYQGRHNPNLPNTDVRGAHAGSANDCSIGLNFLGNADITLPTTVQLDKLKAFLAWWYDNKGLDPTSSASMTTQAYGVQVKPRICGHKDVGQTSCPGTILYNYLPSIRTGTKAIIDSCGNPPPPTGPINLQVVVGNCPNPNVNMSWTNTGNGWYILLANNQTYSAPYIKWISGISTTSGPTGFVLQSDGTSPLNFVTGTAYYWKIWDGSTFTNGPSFIYPMCDDVSPVTSIANSGNWKTQDFSASFTDVDNVGGSGIARKFYQVIEFDGNYWGANFQRGFFADNFETINSNIWTVPASSGTWSIVNNALVQSDESINNTNIYAPLTQTLSNTYLYHFTAKVEGAGHANGRRFGFHYFCDDASQTNRGNSYFIWFRIETNKLEFYKVVNNTFSLESVIDDIVTTLGITYDFKILYDRITGESYVFRNDELIGYWKDQQPFSSSGDYISFRTGNSKLTVNELKVYRTRASSVNITVGNNSAKEIRFQNQNEVTIAAKIKSLSVDSANNISAIAFHDLNVDWTKPLNISFINDGSGPDTDTVYSVTEFSANWGNSTDPNSGIESYWYAIGTNQGDTDIVNWTNNGLNTSVIHSGLNLSYGTTYYVSVKARNGAGLFSDISSSNGAILYSPSGVLAASFYAHSTMLCEGEYVQFFDQSMGAVTYEWAFEGGTPAVSNSANPVITYDSAGTFNVELRVFDVMNNSDTLILQQYITVNPTPKASFSAIDSVVYLPDAFVYFSNNSASATSYFWSFGDSYISTDVNPWHEYATAGTYTVFLTAGNSLCGYDTLVKTNYVSVVDPNTINETNADFSINLYQNPVQDNLEIYLILAKPTSLRFELVDVLGQVFVLKETQLYDTGKQSLNWNLSNRIASGIYSLKITSSDTEQTVIKLLKL
ncbi:MAG: N-acetylmuramoyl-L-alanine amidase [Bacteroidales bacterium]|nr:N-acetylmuramoyl-L-alanine amidase [Bacteroidales bacterium]